MIIKYGLPLIHHFKKTNSEDNSGEFSKRCKRLGLEKWHRVLVNVSVCLLTSHSIRNVIFTFAPLGVVLKMYEDIKWHNVISNLKHFFG